MTYDHYIKILLKKSWKDFCDETPAGLSPDELYGLIIEIAQGYELETIILRHLGLAREMYGDHTLKTYYETDCDLRDRALVYLKANHDDSSKQSCQHNFTTYHGFIDTYEYCTICDEKRSHNEH